MLDVARHGLTILVASVLVERHKSVKLDLTNHAIALMVVALIPVGCGRLAKRLVRKKRHEAAAWAAIIGAALAAIPLSLLILGTDVLDNLEWPSKSVGPFRRKTSLYFCVLLIALLWGFLDCFIRFVRLVAWDMRRGPSRSDESDSSDEESFDPR